MLDAFKRRGVKKPVEDIENDPLLIEVRKEREALTVLLGRLKREAAPVQDAAMVLSRIDAAVALANGRLEVLTSRLSSVETAARTTESLDEQVRALVVAVREAQTAADRLLSPDGELQRQRQVVQQLAAQSMQARATLEALTDEQSTLERLRGDLQSAQGDVQAARDRAAASRPRRTRCSTSVR